MSAPMLGGPQPPQSARSILENILYAEAKLQPDELHFRLDAYAHELAEKQRKWAVEDDSGASRADGYGSYENVLNAANLIDPEVKGTRCIGCGNPQDDGQVHGHGEGFGGCV